MFVKSPASNFTEIRLVAAAMLHAGGRGNRTQERRTDMIKLLVIISYYKNALKNYVSPTFQGRVSGVFCSNSWIFVDWKKVGFCCCYICSVVVMYVLLLLYMFCCCYICSVVVIYVLLLLYMFCCCYICSVVVIYVLLLLYMFCCYICSHFIF